MKSQQNFEIGQKVRWQVETTRICMTLRGLFLSTIDNELSEVRCYEKDGLPCHFTGKVVTNLLEYDND